MRRSNDTPSSAAIASSPVPHSVHSNPSASRIFPTSRRAVGSSSTTRARRPDGGVVDGRRICDILCESRRGAAGKTMRKPVVRRPISRAASSSAVITPIVAP